MKLFVLNSIFYPLLELLYIHISNICITVHVLPGRGQPSMASGGQQAMDSGDGQQPGTQRAANGHVQPRATSNTFGMNKGKIVISGQNTHI
jgi:hypothetical protein